MNYLNALYGDVVDIDVIQLFRPHLASYEINAYENGNFLQWKTDIKTRLFDDEQRLLEYKEAMKIFRFSSRNRNYENPLLVALDLLSGITDISNYKAFHDPINDFTHKYLFTYDTSNLFLTLIIDEKMLKQLDRFFIFSFTITGLDFTENLESRTFSIVKREEELVCVPFSLINDNKERKEEEVIQEELVNENNNFHPVLYSVVEDYKLFKVNVPLELLKYNLQYSNYKLCYNLLTYEQIYDNIWIVSARKYLDPEIGVIELV
ncbi:hypothetical protein [Paenibacillus sp. GYB003]|uniref:hypothetical protein n=1 Tax=Paenibacillus sp. GYB003 TaxID=2994392 RepID=UPI002F9650C2